MSVVQICNVALARIGHTNPIASLTEKSAAAQNCTLLYEFCRDAVLRDGEWGFARRAVALALVSGGTFPGWQFVYRYPNDCMAARHVLPESGTRLQWTGAWDGIQTILPGSSKIPWTVASDDLGRLILTDLEEAWLIYTGTITDPNTFTQSFRDAMAWRLAVELAMPLTKDRRIADDMDRKYQRYLDIAKRSSMNETQQDPAPESVSITGRF